MNDFEHKVREAINVFLDSIMDAAGVADRGDLVDPEVLARLKLDATGVERRRTGQDEETWQAVRDHNDRLAAIESAVTRALEVITDVVARVSVLERSASETLLPAPPVPQKRTRTKVEKPDLADRLVKLLGEHGKPMAMGDLAAQVGLPPSHVRSALHVAIERGMVATQGKKRTTTYSVIGGAVRPTASALRDDPYAPESEREEAPYYFEPEEEDTEREPELAEAEAGAE